MPPSSTTETEIQAGRRQRRFLRRVTLATACGEGLDGYDLGIISVVLLSISEDLEVSTVWTGLLGASSLIGIFIGGPLFGRVTARFGRRRPFMVNIVCFVALGVAQAFVQSVEQLFVLRILLGMAIGAEYAIGSPLLAEFAPAERRGRLSAWLIASWYIGFLVSVLAGYVMLDVLGIGWRWIMAGCAVPALITLILRSGMPESPRWLMSRGRRREAREVSLEHLGDEAHFDREIAGEPLTRGRVSGLLSPAYRRRTLLVCGFWACNVAPYFAIVTFAPQVFGALALDEQAATIATNAMAVAGAVTGVVLIDRLGRRPLLIVPFWVCAAALAIIGVWPAAPVAIIIGCFVTFGFFNAIGGTLTGPYPSELFPTDLRTTAVGVGAAASRIGAALGTFLLPLGLDTIGIGPSMLVGAAFCVAGAMISQLWAPETAGRRLVDTSSAEGRERPRSAAKAAC
ncbi:MAG: transporter, putative metabolite transport protein [Solirubrobacteraceae bacterium]|jgi:putative MFS transporter|nr:transporter, putative metabolite transport protein [Solirubrobacteraceae bacterium]